MIKQKPAKASNPLCVLCERAGEGGKFKGKHVCRKCVRNLFEIHHYLGWIEPKPMK